MQRKPQKIKKLTNILMKPGEATAKMLAHLFPQHIAVQSRSRGDFRCEWTFKHTWLEILIKKKQKHFLWISIHFKTFNK